MRSRRHDGRARSRRCTHSTITATELCPAGGPGGRAFTSRGRTGLTRKESAMTRRGYRPTQIDIEPITVDELDAARGFLEENLRDCADEQRERAAFYEDKHALLEDKAAD